MNVSARNYITAITFLFLFITGIKSYSKEDSATAYVKGKDLFRELCSACHGVHQEITGPMLASIPKKKKEEWLIRFIHNSQEVIKSGDPYAVHLFEQYKQHIMPPFKYLTDTDIKNILFYIQTESRYPTQSLRSDKGALDKGNPIIIQGQGLFLQHCSSCHFTDRESYYAPSLGSVSKRHPKDWLISFIRNSTQVIASGDVYANDLFQAYEKHTMVPMEFLTNEDINAILTYIEFASSSHELATGENGKKMNGAFYLNTPVYDPEAPVNTKTSSDKNANMIFILIISISMMVLICVLLVFYARQKHWF